MDAGTVEATLRLRDEMGPALGRARDELGKFVKQANGAGSATSGFGKLIDQADEFARNLKSTGVAITAGIGIPLAATVKIASDFESAFANVVKTVDGLDVKGQFGTLSKEGQELRKEIRQLAKEIPVAASELANMAAIGGQFGIERKNLVDFTKTVASLAVAVDGISAEEAASSLAQFVNVTGEGQDKIGRFADVLVDLGNKGNSTEGAILEFAKRLSGAGHQAGLSGAEIFGVGAAMANLGLNAEAGGTAMSKLLSEMSRASAQGGEATQMFADFAGRIDQSVSSGQAFADLFQRDAAAALQLFFDGLNDASMSGENLNVILDSLGINEARMRDTTLRLAGAKGELGKQIKIATDQFKTGGAASEEAQKKYATFENQIKLLRNQVYDVAIELGGPLIEALRNVVSAATPVVSAASSMAQFFSALPGPVRQVIAMLGLGAGLSGVMMILTGKAIETWKSVAELVKWIRALQAAQASATAVGALSTSVGALGNGLARISGILAAGGGIMMLLTGAAGYTAASQAIDEYQEKLKGTVDKTMLLAMAHKMSGGAINDFNSAWRYLNQELQKAEAQTGGVSDHTKNLRAALDATNPFLDKTAGAAKLAQGSLAGLGATMPKINLAMDAAGATSRDYVKELATMKAQADALPASVKANVLAFLEQGGSISEASKEFQLSEGVLKQVKVTQKETAKAVDEHTEALKRMKEAATEAANAALMNAMGGDAIGEAMKMADVVARLPKGFAMTQDAADDANKVIKKGIEALARLGIPIPKYMKDAAQQTQLFAFKVQGLTDDFDEASIASKKIAEPQFDQAITSYRMAAYYTAEWAKENENLLRKMAAVAGMSGLADQFFGGGKQGVWGGIGKGLKDVAGGLGDTLVSAFTGGGGLDGALKAVAVQITQAISKPLLENMKKLGAQVGTAVAAGVAGAGALGQAWGGQTGAMIATTASTIGGAALATTALGVAAKTSMVAAVGLGAATLGVGAAAVGIYLLAKHYFTVSKAVKEARKDVQSFQEELWKTMTTQQKIEAGGEEWAATLITVRDAYQRMGMTAQDAEHVVADLFDTDNPERARAAMLEINQVVGQFQARLKSANDTMTPLLEQAGELGIRLPQSLLDSIQGLITMGDLTEENIGLFNKLAGAGEVDFDKFGEAAKRYGINEDALGIGFKQFQSDKSAQQMIDDFDLLIRGGASVGTVLHGMREEISKVVADSIQFGTTIPENMKPWIDELARTGQLVDENGQAITDLSKLKFGDEMKLSFEKITDALMELVNTLKGPFIDALKNIPTVKVPFEFENRGGLPGEGFHQPEMLAKGGVLNKPTFVAGESGAEIVSPLKDYNRTMLESYAIGATSRGQAGKMTLILNIDGETMARKTVPYMDGVLEMNGV